MVPMITSKNATTELLLFRERHGVTQKRLCAETGVSEQTICSIESGNKPRVMTVFKLNEYIKTFPDER